MKVAKRSDPTIVFAEIVGVCKVYHKAVDSWVEDREEDDEPTKYLVINIKTNQGFHLQYTGPYEYMPKAFLRYSNSKHRGIRKVEAKLTVRKKKSPISVDGLAQLKRFTDSAIFKHFDFTESTKRNIIRHNRPFMQELGLDLDNPWTLAEISNQKNADLAKIKTTKHEIIWVGGQELLNKSMNALLRSLGKLEQVKI